jgi:lipid II isoglutaminyl synthase (glutamine-hydrolysing)
MPKIFLSILVFATARLANILLILARLMKKNGTSLPGLIIEKYLPFLLRPLTQDYKEIILISGTNGKTTTRAILNHIYESNNVDVCTNRGGANIIRGIASALLLNLDWFNKPKKQILILEVEEASLPILTRYCTPSKLILTNIFRDQMDAYGALDTTIDYFTQSITQIAAHSDKYQIIVNGDDEKLLSCLPKFCLNNVITFGIKDDSIEKLSFENTLEHTVFEAQESYIARNIVSDSTTMNFTLAHIPHKSGWSGISIKSALTGTYNIYNILAAISASIEKFDKDIIVPISDFQAVFGRGEKIKFYNSEIELQLVKNPAGFNQVLNILKSNNINNSIFMINDNIADGKDVSWLWDTNFEKYLSNKTMKYLTGGSRGLDMLLRLEIAGLSVTIEDYIKDTKDILSYIKNHPGKYFVCTTYTALLDFREQLSQQVQLKKIDSEGY